jgi:hypothetical protein
MVLSGELALEEVNEYVERKRNRMESSFGVMKY